MNYAQHDYALAHVACSTIQLWKNIDFYFSDEVWLNNHLLRKGIDCGYELEKKHFILFNWFLFAYEHITSRQFLEVPLNAVLEISFPVFGHCIK